MAPSPELGQPKAPDKADDEHQKHASGSGDTTDRTAGTTTTGSSGNDIRDRNISASGQINSGSTSTTINSHGGCGKPGTTSGTIAIPAVISTMAMSAATTTTTTTPATAVKVSSSSTTTPTVASTATATSGGHTKTAESSKSSSSSVPATGSNNNKDSQFQPSAQEPLATMNEDALKALLDEAITYKCPKDREHKSATFNELLSKTEREDQEQNFSFASRPVLSKRASARPTQGGSLQDITEATKQEYGYTEYCSGSSLTNKRHGGGGHGGSRTKRQVSSVSSRQREGGSLPSNVNETTTPSYISEQPFLNEVRRPLKSTSVKLASAKTNDYGALLQSAPLNAMAGSDWSRGEESHLAKAGGADSGTGTLGVGSHTVVGGGAGSGSAAVGHTVINMGELDSDEPSVVSGHSGNALQQSNNYESSVDDIELMAMGSSAGTAGSGCSTAVGAGVTAGSIGGLSGAASTTSVSYGGTDSFGNGIGCSSSNSSSSSSGGGGGTGGMGGSGGSSGLSSAKKTFCYPKPQYTTQASLEIGQACNVTRPASVHHVDKTVSLPMLEAVQLGSTYPAVKCMIDSSKVDQSTIKSVLSTNNQFISTTRSSLTYPTIQQKFDENANSVSQFGGSSGSGITAPSAGSSSQLGGAGSGGGSGSGPSGPGGASKKPRKPKSDRNTVVVVPENIAGYRGQFEIEALVSYIENDDSDKPQKPSSQQPSSTKVGGANSVVSVGGSSGTGGGTASTGASMKIPRVQVGGYSNASTAAIVVGAAGGASGSTTENGKEEERGKRKNEKKRERAAAAKMKKSNSLEELSSCSRKKVEEENTRQNHVEKARAQETDPAVTLRSSKSKKNQSAANANAASSSSTTTSSSNLTAKGGGDGAKRGERRSWGTEELTFLGNDMRGSTTLPIEAVEALASSATTTSGKGKKDKKEQNGNNSTVASGRNISSDAMTSSSMGGSLASHNRKRDSLRMSVESLSAVAASGIGSGGGESSDFHVVTKKKKTKKKIQNLGPEEGSGQTSGGIQSRRYPVPGVGGGTYGRNSNNGNNCPGGGSASAVTGRYQASNHFTVDRDVYMNNDVSRRKSTSSVPPSEKSDSSDADSVHSLPIETNAARKQQQKQQAKKQPATSVNQQHQQQTSQQQQRQSGASQSYAEIARIPNAPAEKNAGGSLLLAAGNIGALPMGSGVSGDGGLPDGASNSSVATTGSNSNVGNLLQDLNSSVAFPQLVESHHHTQGQPPQLVSTSSTSSSVPSSSGSQHPPSQQSATNSVTAGTVYSGILVSANSSGSNSISNSSHSAVGTRATYSQSLLTAVNNVADEKNNGMLQNHHQQQPQQVATPTSCSIPTRDSTESRSVGDAQTSASNGGGAGGGEETKVQKSKSVDNTHDIYYSNEHYPALEKTVKGHHHHHQRAANNNNNGVDIGTVNKTTAPKGGSSAVAVNTMPCAASTASCACAGGSVLSFGQVTASNAATGPSSGGAGQPTSNPIAKKGKSKKESTVTTANSTTTAHVDATVDAPVSDTGMNHNSAVLIDTDTQIATMLPFDTRIPMNGGAAGAIGVSTIHFLQTSPQSQPQNAQPVSHVGQQSGKRQKKEKQSSGAGKGATVGSSSGNNAHGGKSQQHQHQTHRPAVIIMNDHEPKSNEFSFGFDSDHGLLFGDFSEEDRSLLEGPCPVAISTKHENAKDKQHQHQQQRSRNVSSGGGVDSAENSSALSPDANTPVQLERTEYYAQPQPLQQAQPGGVSAIVSPAGSSSNDTRNCSIGQASSSSASSSVSSSSASLSPSVAGVPAHSYQQPIAQAILIAPAAISDTQQQLQQQKPQQQQQQPQQQQSTGPDDSTKVPHDGTGTVAASNMYHQPPPTAVLLHTIYTQPPPSLPHPPPHHLMTSTSQPQQASSGPSTTSASRPPRHHNPYPLPPPAVVPSSSTDPNGNASAPTAVLITVPPPPLGAIVPSYGVLIPPTGGAHLAPATVTATPVAAGIVSPLVVPVAIQQTSSMPTTLVGKGTVASTTPTAVIGDTINNNNITNQHQQPRQSSPATPVVTTATNINSIAQSYQQHQLQLQQQMSSAAAQTPTAQLVTTVDSAAQTLSPTVPNQQYPSSTSSSSSPSSSASGPNIPPTPQAPQQPPTTAQPPVREKMKEINLRFIAPEQVHTTEYNHDKIVFFVGAAWEDAICGNNGTTKYYEDQ